MREFLSEYYLVIKSLHLIFVISWMAALLYLPRLFVYHSGAKIGSELSETLKVMEFRLTRIIMTPAMIGAFLFGVLLLLTPGVMAPPMGWLHLKLLLVFGLAGFHGYLVYVMKSFQRDANQNTSKFYRMINEVPALVMIGVIFLVVMKPF